MRFRRTLRLTVLSVTCILGGCVAFVGERADREAAAADSAAADSAAIGARAQRPAGDPVPLQTRVLANGLRVIVHENPVVPLVTIEVDVKNGAYTQTPEFEGLAHLYEHMFFKANRMIPSQERWLERQRELGIVFNGTTGAERVNYYFTLHRDDLTEGLEFMRDAIRYPLFNRAELERERAVVLGEYDRLESSPPFFLARAVDSLLWTPGYFSRKNPIGNRDVIAGTSREKMLAIQERYYVPNNSALILAGDVKAAEAFALAEKVFGDWERQPDPFGAFPVPPVPPLTSSRAVVVERPVNSVTVTLKWQGPSVTRNSAATYAADVFSTIVALPASGFQRRIVDSGLAFSASLTYESLAHTGPLRLQAQTTPEKVVPLVRALKREIAAFDDAGYFRDEDLAGAQSQLLAQDAFRREQPASFAHTLGYWWAVASLQYYLNYVPNVMNVDREDVTAFVRTYLQGRPRVTGVLIRAEDRARIGLRVEDLL